MAQDIVAQFPIVSKADLLYGDSCAICHETYASEAAVRLPCGHEFGFECISTWLSPEGGRTTCPLCRHQLVPGATSSPEAEETSAIWENLVTAIELDIELTEMWPMMYSSRRFRECLLYAELHSQGADLPPWEAESDAGVYSLRLNAAQEEALFQELQRRGAFLVLPIEVDPLVTVREIWEILREQGYLWDPVRVAHSIDNCGWTRV